MDPAAAFPPENPPHTLEGRTLEGRYRVVSRLGAGGMATVYLAEDLRLSRSVVVKVPHPSLLQEEGFRKRFEHEIGHLTVLEHPRVVRVQDSGMVDGIPFAVMQHLSGGSLTDRVRTGGGRQGPAEVRGWLPAVAEGLDFLHRKGMVHRDVKPDNVLFDGEGNAHVADFGILKAVGGMETRITRTGLLAGSPAYMPPEVVRGGEPGPAFDQYSLGVVVYEVLAGRLPHEGETPLSILTKRAYEPPAELAPFAPDLPEGAVRAVMRAVSRDPGERFPSCGEFAAAFVEGLGTPVAGTEFRTLAPAAPAAPPPAAAGPEAPSRPRGRVRRREREGAATTAPERRRPLLVGGGIVLAAGAAAWIGFAGGGDAPAGPPSESPPARSPPPGSAPPPPPRSGSPEPEAPPSAGEPGLPWTLVTPDGAPDWVRVSPAQVEAAARHGVPPWSENDLGMRFVLVPEGRFLMGAPADEAGRREGDDLHPVTLTRPYYLQITEVTNGQFREWNPAHTSGEMDGQDCDGDLQPVFQVSLAEAEGFCSWLCGREEGRRYRLPTEAEWERACRAGTEGPWFWGDDPDQAVLYANAADETCSRFQPDWRRFRWDDGHHAPAPVGSFAPNPWGLHDLMGNVAELCPDRHGPFEPGREEVDPRGPAEGDTCVSKGGCFATGPPFLRASYRWPGDRTHAWNDSGFRVLLEVPGGTSRETPETPPGPEARIAEPAEGVSAAEGEVLRVRGTIARLPEGAVLRVNGVAARVEGGNFEASITLDPGEREIEVLAGLASLGIRTVRVEASPRPEGGEGLPAWAQVSARQVAEARRVGVPVAFENPLGMRFVLVPAGRFRFGAPPGTPGAPIEGRRIVTLTRPFYLQITEVTNAQVRAWHPPHRTGAFEGVSLDGEDCPAAGLGEENIDGFIAWVREKDPGRNYRLPTEAEWEYACRAGTTGRFWWGEDEALLPRYANVSDLSARKRWPMWNVFEVDDGHAAVAPVASFAPNPWGIYDLFGNASEYCADGVLSHGTTPLVDPRGPPPGENTRALRGGAWITLPDSVRAGGKGWKEPNHPEFFLGIRLVAEVRGE